MTTEVRLATPADAGVVLSSTDVFDTAPRPDWTQEFLSDPRHHMLLALDGGALVGFLSGNNFLHPDKPPTFWIAELGVNESHQRQGIATRLVAAAEAHARSLECQEIWVFSDPTPDALGFYTSLGWAREGSHIAMFTKVLTP